MSTPSARAAVVRNAFGIGIATGAYALSFGALATASGLTVAQACALSLLMFTGASQYAFIGVVAGGGSAWSGAATAVLLGSRNALYGLQLARVLAPRGAGRALAAQGVIDETTAMTVAQESEELARVAFWATAASIYALWNAGTVIGAVAGHALSDPKVLGLDAAVPAAFLALLTPRLRDRSLWLVAAAAAAVAVVTVPLTRPGVPVLLAAVVAVVVVVAGKGGRR